MKSWNKNPYKELKPSHFQLTLKWNHSSDKFFYLRETLKEEERLELVKTLKEGGDEAILSARQIIGDAISKAKDLIKTGHTLADEKLGRELGKVLSVLYSKESDRISAVQEVLIQHELALAESHVKLSQVYDWIISNARFMKVDICFEVLEAHGIHDVYARKSGSNDTGQKVGTFYLGEYRFILQDDATANPVYINLANRRPYVKDLLGQFVPRYILRGINDDDAWLLGEGDPKPIKAMLDWDEGPRKEERSWYQLPDEVDRLNVEQKVISQIRGQKRLISATKSKRMMTSTRGVGFESIFGTVRLDLAQIPEEHIIDASGPKAMEEIFTKQLEKGFVAKSESLLEALEDLKEERDLPKWGQLSSSSNSLIKNTVLAARDVWRTREVLIKGPILRKAVLHCLPKRDDSVLVLAGLPNSKTKDVTLEEREMAVEIKDFFEKRFVHALNQYEERMSKFSQFKTDQVIPRDASVVKDVMLNLQRKISRYDARCAYILLDNAFEAQVLKVAVDYVGSELVRVFKPNDNRRERNGIKLLGKFLGVDLKAYVLPRKYYGYAIPEEESESGVEEL